MGRANKLKRSATNEQEKDPLPPVTSPRPHLELNRVARRRPLPEDARRPARCERGCERRRDGVVVDVGPDEP